MSRPKISSAASPTAIARSGYDFDPTYTTAYAMDYKVRDLQRSVGQPTTPRAAAASSVSTTSPPRINVPISTNPEPVVAENGDVRGAETMAMDKSVKGQRTRCFDIE